MRKIYKFNFANADGTARDSGGAVWADVRKHSNDTFTPYIGWKLNGKDTEYSSQSVLKLSTKSRNEVAGIIFEEDLFLPIGEKVPSGEIETLPFLFSHRVGAKKFVATVSVYCSPYWTRSGELRPNFMFVASAQSRDAHDL